MGSEVRINWETPKIKEALEGLSEEQKPVFKALAEDRFFEAVKRGHFPYKNWTIVAALVRGGWRRG